MLLVISGVFAMSVWFSSAAILPMLKRQSDLTAGWAALAGSPVVLGFVCGMIASAVLGLSDRGDPRRFYMVCCFVAALANLLMIRVHPANPLTFLLRGITGAMMAGVYPVGMKLASSWAEGDRGFLVGLLVGAVTPGSASPHLIGAYALDNWRSVLVISSALAFVSVATAWW